MSSTKEQIQKAAMGAFRKEKVVIGDAEAMLRELSVAEANELRKVMYETDDAGVPICFDKDGKRDANGSMWHFRPGMSEDVCWIAATIEPHFTIDEIKEWPKSLRARIFAQVRNINGIEPDETVAKN